MQKNCCQNCFTILNLFWIIDLAKHLASKGKISFEQSYLPTWALDVVMFLLDPLEQIVSLSEQLQELPTLTVAYLNKKKKLPIESLQFAQFGSYLLDCLMLHVNWDLVSIASHRQNTRRFLSQTKRNASNLCLINTKS